MRGLEIIGFGASLCVPTNLLWRHNRLEHIVLALPLLLAFCSRSNGFCSSYHIVFFLDSLSWARFPGKNGQRERNLSSKEGHGQVKGWEGQQKQRHASWGAASAKLSCGALATAALHSLEASHSSVLSVNPCCWVRRREGRRHTVSHGSWRCTRARSGVRRRSAGRLPGKDCMSTRYQCPKRLRGTYASRRSSA